MSLEPLLPTAVTPFNAQNLQAVLSVAMAEHQRKALVAVATVGLAGFEIARHHGAQLGRQVVNWGVDTVSNKVGGTYNSLSNQVNNLESNRPVKQRKTDNGLIVNQPPKRARENPQQLGPAKRRQIESDVVVFTQPPKPARDRKPGKGRRGVRVRKKDNLRRRRRRRK